ncbi:hypothetical protein CAEBREN_29055, partial [Caenorhabditis brenneri]
MSYVIHELDDDLESATDRIGETLKEAREAETIDKKIVSLSTAMHLLCAPNISNYTLDNFLTEMLEFADLNDSRIICLIIDFLLKASAKDFTVCNKAVERYSFYLIPNNQIAKYQSVIKRVVVASTNLYPIILEYAINDKDVQAERCWEAFNLMKSRICMLVDNDHEGVRTVTVKFLEALILCQSPKPKELDPKSVWAIEANTRFHKISLTDVPRNHRFLSYHKAQLEAEENFSALLKQTSFTGITSQNLIAVIESLCIITRCRPTWENALPRVFDVIKALHSNVPPMLSKGQVKFLRKSFKYNLLRFLKLPASVPLQKKIVTMLTDYLGASSREVNQSIPQELIQRAAPRPPPNMEPAAKRAKLTNQIFDDDDDDDEPGTSTTKDARTQAIDMTAKFILERLNHETVLNLVKISLYTLPTEMPAAFASSYTPIANAGSEPNRQELAELMAVQMTNKEIGPGYEWLQQKKKKEYEARNKARSEGIAIAPTPHHEPSTGRMSMKAPAPVEKPTAQKAKKAFNLVEETEKLTREEAADMFDLAFESVLLAERRVVAGGAKSDYQKLVVRLATRFWEDCSPYEEKLVSFVLKDHKRRSDLALLWLCELYAQYQGYSNCALRIKEKIENNEGSTQAQRLERYDHAMCRILDSMLERKMEKETLFYKILLETPLLTPNATERLKNACLAKENEHGMSMLRELILTRNRQRPQLLQFLFGLCFLDRPDLRTSCIDTVKELCNLPFIRSSLSDQARMQITDCLEATPPIYMRRDPKHAEWTEEMYKNAFAVYSILLPSDPLLLAPLAHVYSQGNGVLKRIILRTLEPVYRQLSQEMIQTLIEDCPHGAETLLARLVVLLSERVMPSIEFVQKLKNFHDERKMDLRALLPIIGGLPKDEVFRLIPAFIFKAEYQKNVSILFRRIYSVRDPNTGESIFDPVEIITEYHKIEAKDHKEAELLVKLQIRLIRRESLLQSHRKADVPTIGTMETGVPHLHQRAQNESLSGRFVSCHVGRVRGVEGAAWQRGPRRFQGNLFDVVHPTAEEYGVSCEGNLKIIGFFSFSEKIKEELHDKERENRDRDRRLRREERKEKDRTEKER